MGTLSEKLTYLSNAVNDIQAAINEKDIIVDDTLPLREYGNKIREIKSALPWADYCVLNGYPSVLEEDLVVKDIQDVTDLAVTGNIEGADIVDYIACSAHPCFTEQDIVCKDVEDATDTIEVAENNYTNL